MNKVSKEILYRKEHRNSSVQKTDAQDIPVEPVWNEASPEFF